MLNGKELGKAIQSAIDLKIQSGAIRTKADVATYFGVKPPSIYDWVRRGTISKDKLVRLWDYFSDVVGPEHWGVYGNDHPKTGCARPQPRPQKQATALSNEEETLIKAYRSRSKEGALPFRVESRMMSWVNC